MTFMFLKWFVFLILNLSTNILNFPLAPIVVLFVKKDGYLPGWLWWFQTPDNPLSGDKDWQTKYRPFLNESNIFKRWVNRFRWLYRNKLYGFNVSVMSVYFKNGDHMTTIGDTSVKNDPVGHSGLLKRYLYNEKNKLIAFQWYYIHQYKRWPHKCIRINIGWKLWDYYTKAYSSFVFSPSPWMHYIQ